MARKPTPEKKVWKNYEAYLASPEWDALREKAMNRDDRKCRVCGRAAEQVHHHKYPKDWNDDCLANLVCACGTCHKRIHGLDGSVDTCPWRNYQRAIGVKWEDGYSLVLTGTNRTGDKTEILVDETQVTWLLETIRRCVQVNSENIDSPSLSEVWEDLHDRGRSILMSLDMIASALDKDTKHEVEEEPA